MNSRMFNMLNSANSVNPRSKGRSPNLELKRKRNELKIDEIKMSKDDRRKNKKKKVSKNLEDKTK